MEMDDALALWMLFMILFFNFLGIFIVVLAGVPLFAELWPSVKAFIWGFVLIMFFSALFISLYLGIGELYEFLREVVGCEGSGED